MDEKRKEFYQDNFLNAISAIDFFYKEKIDLNDEEYKGLLDLLQEIENSAKTVRENVFFNALFQTDFSKDLLK